MYLNFSLSCPEGNIIGHLQIKGHNLITRNKIKIVIGNGNIYQSFMYFYRVFPFKMGNSFELDFFSLHLLF